MKWILALTILVMLAYCWTHAAEPLIDIPNKSLEKTWTHGRNTITQTKIKGTTVEQLSEDLCDTASVKIQSITDRLKVNIAILYEDTHNFITKLFTRRRPDGPTTIDGTGSTRHSPTRTCCL